MTKVYWALFVAGLFISGVLLFVTIQGVSLKERRMIKWSAVDTAEQAGTKVARFLYPISKQFLEITVRGDSKFARVFFDALKEEGVENWRQSQFSLNPVKPSESGFLIDIHSIDFDYISLCRTGDNLSCTGAKALNNFLKKPRDSSSNWINMFRINNREAIYFLKLRRINENTKICITCEFNRLCPW